MALPLKGREVLIIIGPDFEDREVFYPLYRLREAGANVTIGGIGERMYKGKYGIPLDVDGHTSQLQGKKWDAVVIPGGWAPDKIRMDEAALHIVQETHKNKGVVAAICHGGWVLASAHVVENRRVTSFVAIKDDLIHAGAKWEDSEVVVDENIVTARKPDDLPAFCREIIGLLSRVKATV